MNGLGVSRNSVREALKALQALDIVDIRHGYGTYVGQASLTPFVDGLTFRTLARQDDTNETGALAEILQVREVLEEGLIHRVAAVLTETELDRLEAVVAEMEEAGRAGRPFPELDREFHELLYAPLGNALVPQLLGAFWTVFSRVMRRPRLDGRPGTRGDRPPPPGHRHGAACPRRRGRAARDGRPLPGYRGEGGAGVARGELTRLRGEAGHGAGPRVPTRPRSRRPGPRLRCRAATPGVRSCPRRPCTSCRRPGPGEHRTPGTDSRPRRAGACRVRRPASAAPPRTPRRPRRCP